MKVILKHLRFPFTHYKTLNLQHNATPEQIKTQYLFLAKQNHPDVNNSDQESFHKIK